MPGLICMWNGSRCMERVGGGWGVLLVCRCDCCSSSARFVGFFFLSLSAGGWEEGERPQGYSVLQYESMSSFWGINHTELCEGEKNKTKHMLFIFGSSHTDVFRALIFKKIHVKCLSLSLKKKKKKDKKCLQRLAGSYLLCNHLTTKLNDLLWCLFLCSGFVLGCIFFTHTQSDPSFIEELRKIIRNEVLKIFEGIFRTATHCIPASFNWDFLNYPMAPSNDTAPPPGLITKPLWLPAQNPVVHPILSFVAFFCLVSQQPGEKRWDILSKRSLCYCKRMWQRGCCCTKQTIMLYLIFKQSLWGGKPSSVASISKYLWSLFKMHFISLPSRADIKLLSAAEDTCGHLSLTISRPAGTAGTSWSGRITWHTRRTRTSWS